MSSARMSAEEIERGLVAQGVPREQAHRVAFRPDATVRLPATVPYVRRVLLPFHMTIPWSELCSDNERKSAAQTRLGDGKVYPRLMTSKRYKTAKDAIAERAKRIVGTAMPTDGPLEIRVRVWLPPARRNDAINFAKVVHDALEGVIYQNDNQLHRAVWERAGIDIDAPRAEIEIHPIPEQP